LSFVVFVDPALHPHFTELDHLSKGRDANLIAYVQPAQALKYDTHYAVVVQGLTDGYGGLLSPTALMRDYITAYESSSAYTSGSGADISRYQRFTRTVFPALKSAALNASLSQVQLVWDFHTASQTSIVKPLQRVYNSTLERVRQQLGLSEENVQAELNHQAFDIQPSDEFNRQHDSRGAENDIYRLLSHARPSCKGASSLSMASRVYYRISVPWYLKTIRVSMYFTVTCRLIFMPL
jgi:hypothetical protein